MRSEKEIDDEEKLGQWEAASTSVRQLPESTHNQLTFPDFLESSLVEHRNRRLNDFLAFGVKKTRDGQRKCQSSFYRHVSTEAILRLTRILQVLLVQNLDPKQSFPAECKLPSDD